MKNIAESHSQHTFTFHSISGKENAFKLIHASHVEHKDKQFIELKLELDELLFLQVTDSQWFNFHPTVVLHDYNFVADSPIVVSLVLSPAVTVQLLQQGYELEHFMAGLFKVNTDQITAVTQQENWFLVEAMQTEHIADIFPDSPQASLNIGFKTSWYNILVTELIFERKLSTPEVPANTLMSDVARLLVEQRIEYEVNDSNIYIQFNHHQHNWTEIIRVDEQARQIICYAKFPNSVPIEQMDKISLVLLNENYSLSEGAFELDYDDGDLRFRTTILSFGQLELRHLAHVLTEHIEVMGQYIPAIEQYLNG